MTYKVDSRIKLKNNNNNNNNVTHSPIYNTH